MTNEQIKEHLSKLQEHYSKDGYSNDPCVLYTNYESYTASELLDYIYSAVVERDVNILVVE